MFLIFGRGAFEAEYISEIPREYRGNVSHVATALDMSRVALQRTKG